MIKIVPTHIYQQMRKQTDDLIEQNKRLIAINEEQRSTNLNLLDFSKTLFTRTAVVSGIAVALLIIILIILSIKSENA